MPFFETDAKRMAHPSVRFIPADIMRDVFNYELSDFQLELMGASWEELMSSLGRNPEKVNKFLDWVCIAFSHPLWADDELMNLADMLSLSSSALLEAAILTEELPIINSLMEVSPADQMIMLRAEYYRPFHKAAERCNLRIMERLIEILMELSPDDVFDMLTINNYEIFRIIASAGRLDILGRLVHTLMEISSDEVLKMIGAEDYLIVRTALSQRRYPVVDKLVELDPLLTMGHGAIAREIANLKREALSERGIFAVAPDRFFSGIRGHREEGTHQCESFGLGASA